MKLYSTTNSTFCRRVRMSLLEKQQLDRVEEIDMPAEVRRTPEYLAINPYGRIPALVDGDQALFESTAILEYLEEKFPNPSLLPDDPVERAHVRMLCKLCDLEYSNHAVVIQRPKRKLPEADWDLEAFAAEQPRIALHYEFLEDWLRDREWLVGGRFTLADLCYVPFLHFEHLLDVALPPRVQRWMDRLMQRDSAQQTVPSE